VLLYPVSNEALTWATAQISACFGALDKSQLGSGVPHRFHVDRVADVSTAMTDENSDSRFGLGRMDIVVGKIVQRAQLFVMG
jgi:hypothetical protein